LKVNISYAVELDDVPVEVGKLLTNVGYYMATLLNEIEEVGTSNPTKAIESISNIRKGLADLDVRLADCSNILGGYVDIQSKVSSGVLTTEEEVDDESPI
jgi:hypothetical protein